MISDAELLKLVMERYPEQPTPFIIEQFTVLKAGLIQANNKLAAMDMEEPVCEQVIIEEPMPEAAEAAPRRRRSSPSAALLSALKKPLGTMLFSAASAAGDFRI